MILMNAMQVLSATLLGLMVLTQQGDPQALQRMAATERAFAAATAEIGVRDGFLTFFADDSIDIVPGATGAKTTLEPATKGLATLAAPKLPLATRLMWEPFTGQVAADGTMGWLTGASVSLSLTTRDVVRKGAY